jgi:regulator of replication initiation timing
MNSELMNFALFPELLWINHKQDPAKSSDPSSVPLTVKKYRRKRKIHAILIVNRGMSRRLEKPAAEFRKLLRVFHQSANIICYLSREQKDSPAHQLLETLRVLDADLRSLLTTEVDNEKVDIIERSIQDHIANVDITAIAPALGVDLAGPPPSGESLPQIIVEFTALTDIIEKLKAFPIPPRLSEEEVKLLDLEETIKRLEADVKEKEDFVRRLQAEKMTLRTENIKLKNELPNIRERIEAKAQKMAQLQTLTGEVSENRVALEEVCAIVKAQGPVSVPKK